jgi:hypothetical protein
VAEADVAALQSLVTRVLSMSIPNGVRNP